MKKVLVALVMIALLVSLCACSVSPDSFMSKAQVNSLVKKYPNPQAVVTLKYETAGTEFEVMVTYNLMLEKAPIAVTRFIQIANADGYNNTLVDTLDAVNKKYMVMGRYEQKDDKYYNVRSGDTTFAGEFQSNGYRMPTGGYEEFSLFSLAMYHDNNADSFNSANGTLLLALDSNMVLNSANYAVFAEFESMTVRSNDGEKSYKKVSDMVLNHLKSFSARKANQVVYDSENENASSVSVSIMSTQVTLTVEILGDYDWTKLPTIR